MAIEPTTSRLQSHACTPSHVINASLDDIYLFSNKKYFGNIIVVKKHVKSKHAFSLFPHLSTSSYPPSGGRLTLYVTFAFYHRHYFRRLNQVFLFSTHFCIMCLFLHFFFIMLSKTTQRFYSKYYMFPI